MNRKMTKIISLLLVVVLVVVSLLVGCGDDDNGNGELSTIYVTLAVPLSGPAASGYEPGVTPYEAYCDYINTEKPIPGVKLEMLYYDTKFDFAQAMPAYQWVTDQGAKFICWTDTKTAVSLLDTVTEDHFPVFLGGGNKAISDNPGYVFGSQTEFNNQTASFMKWLKENWPNYPTKPKIGAFGINDTFGQDHAAGAEDYADAHPDDFEWVGTELAPEGTTSWATEVAKLEDCDYIITGTFAGFAASFINELRAAESDAITVHTDANMSFWAIYDASCGPEKLDGALWIANAGYITTDTYPLVTTVKHIIDTYCTDEEAGIVYGTPYIAISNYISFLFCVEMLREAVDQVDDPADITGEQLYDIITTLELTEEGYPKMAYSETKRVLLTSFKMYEYDAADEDFHQLGDWMTMPGY